MWPDADPHLAPQPRAAALLIIDTQVDFVDGGASPVPGTSEVIPRLVTLRDAFRAAGRPVVHVVRVYAAADVDRVRRAAIAGGARLVAPDSAGAQVVPELRTHWGWTPPADRLLGGDPVEVAGGEFVLWKPRWSAFHRTTLDGFLEARGISTVVVAGCNFPNCPRATLYDASERDYRVLLASDAVSGVTGTHLEELGRLGVLHADTATVAAALKR